MVQLQFPNSDVADVLRFYEQLTGKKLVMDNFVQGKVNIFIGKDVPREEAIKIIEMNLLLNGYSLIPAEDTDIVKVIGTGKNPRTTGVPIVSDETEIPEGDHVISYLFKPGFSTSERADAIAGRGVGLDIVSERINQLRGSYRVENEAGRGFGVFLTVPVNLLWSSVLAVRAGSFEVCLRLSDIREAIVLRATDIVHIDNHICAMVRGEAYLQSPLRRPPRTGYKQPQSGCR